MEVSLLLLGLLSQALLADSSACPLVTPMMHLASSWLPVLFVIRGKDRWLRPDNKEPVGLKGTSYLDSTPKGVEVEGESSQFCRALPPRSFQKPKRTQDWLRGPLGSVQITAHDSMFPGKVRFWSSTQWEAGLYHFMGLKGKTSKHLAHGQSLGSLAEVSHCHLLLPLSALSLYQRNQPYSRAHGTVTLIWLGTLYYSCIGLIQLL